MQNDIDQDKELLKSINRLNKTLNKQMSPLRSFLMAILQGVGTIIGATIVAGIVLGILSETVDSVDDVPILNKMVNSQDLKDLVNNNQDKDK